MPCRGRRRAFRAAARRPPAVAWRNSSPGRRPITPSTGIAPTGHPTQFLRAELARRGVLTAEDLRGATPRSTVRVAGIVTHRQRPMTAQGTTFLNLEDETGLINVVISKGCWKRYRHVVRTYRHCQPEAVATLRRDFRLTVAYYCLEQRFPTWVWTA